MKLLKNKFDETLTDKYEMLTFENEIFKYDSKHVYFDFKCKNCTKEFSETLPRITQGFNFVKETDINYSYTNGQVVYSRETFQKYKLKEYQVKFKYNLTEFENMFNNKYTVLFDCGSLLFEKVYN